MNENKDIDIQKMINTAFLGGITIFTVAIQAHVPVPICAVLAILSAVISCYAFLKNPVKEDKKLDK